MADLTRACAKCGATFQQEGPRGRTPTNVRKSCYTCRPRQKQSPPMVTIVKLCAVCGASFGSKSRTHKFCSDKCRQSEMDRRKALVRAERLLTRPSRFCVECGAEISPEVNVLRKYCSDACSIAAQSRSDAYKRGQAKHKQRRREDPEYRAELNRRKRNVARVCEWCGADYLGRKSRAVRFCSLHCHYGYHNSLRSPVASPWSPKWPDVIRRNVPLEIIKRAMVYAERDRRVRFVGVSCRGCGAVFLWDYRVGGVAAVWCSDRCSVRPARERRRARKRDAYVEDVYRAQVFARDRYRCQICNGRLAMKQVVPHPKAPTIDHIIPLAAGGTHEMKNAQAAHFWCNANKSANAANDQLLLFG